MGRQCLIISKTNKRLAWDYLIFQKENKRGGSESTSTKICSTRKRTLKAEYLYGEDIPLEVQGDINVAKAEGYVLSPNKEAQTDIPSPSTRAPTNSRKKKRVGHILTWFLQRQRYIDIELLPLTLKKS